MPVRWLSLTLTAAQSGFSVNSNGDLAYNGNTQFQVCPTGQNGGYNIYTAAPSGQQGCSSVTLSTGGKCASGSGGASSAAQSSSAASSAAQSSTAQSPAGSSAAQSSPAASQASSAGSQAPSAPASQSAQTSAPGASASSAPGAPASSASSAPASSVPGASQSTAPGTCQPSTVTQTQTVTVTVPAQGGASQGGACPASCVSTVTQPAASTPSAPGSSAPVVPASSAPGASASSAPGAPSSSAPGVPTTSAPGVPASSAPASSQSASSAPGKPSGYGPSSHPTAAPSGSAPAGSQPASSAPGASASASSSAPASSAAQSSAAPSGTASSQASGSACQTSLTGAYETPHLIVPVDSSQPDKAEGTQYNATISQTKSTIFNFDIPSSYSGKQCSLIFLFPQQSQLETSGFTQSGSGGLTFTKLNNIASQSTTYGNVGQGQQIGSISSVSPGNSYVVSTGACAAGQTESIEVSSTNGYELEFFEDWNPSPIGVFITSC